MEFFTQYKLRLARKRMLLRASQKKRQLKVINDRTRAIDPADVLLFCVMRNEKNRLPYFLRYYRALGVQHFLIIDNGSTDGGDEYLAQHSDVSIWSTPHSYKNAGFGIDWLNALLGRYGKDHWCLTVDADEFLTYPFCNTRPLGALTTWLDASSQRAFPAMLLDMYPKGPIDANPYSPGDDPFATLTHFDSGNYRFSSSPRYSHLWIQGGPRMRHFFKDNPSDSPALNKVPLVKWKRGFVYFSSTHMLLPRGLNKLYAQSGGENPSGCLLHAKFLHSFIEKADDEITRREHYADSAEYLAYKEKLDTHIDLYCEHSTRYNGWRQLESLGLISSGGWA